MARSTRDSQFNDLSGSALMGLEWQAGARDRLMPSAGMTWRTYGGKPYARTISTDMRWTHGLGRRSQLDTSFSYGHNRYSTNKLQDGDLYSTSLSLERALSARGGVGVTLSGGAPDRA